MNLTTDYVSPVFTEGHYRVTDSETGRTFTVAQDCDTEDPREWFDDSAELMIYNADRNLSTDEARTRMAEVFARAYDESGDDNRALTIAQRWARAYGDDEQRAAWIDTASIRGYSQSDWAEALIVADSREAGESILATYRQYFAGDVWFVMDDESDDSLGGIYADDPEGAVSEYMEQASA